ncbi:tyrosine-type recombinase/integrase [Bradyrhizobium sp. AUGA SZCCT0283]|uniref:tyrosine-type recombinase/integrase n=1 Tax=Bradyrhizobium sp. AUGA SZCCT0283 TaxID=2807671 RepID=UPI001BA48DEE|nr:tyrosine-type recombinase/integrase [Bradyrhizobium sp. AUGA SZCCT0283]MBR1277457.1 tyrosine-type recombinase/integrase [Bradyrhizobium sp. AUGA SZCCT0283]
MVRANIKGVFRTYKYRGTPREREYWFHRATGLRLAGKPGSPEFISDLAAAENLTRSRLVGTFNGLTRDFTTSVEFTDKLAPSTQREYIRLLTKAEAQFGDLPLAALEDPRVRRDFLDWRQTVSKTSGEREADNRLSVISAMLTWGVDRGRLHANHLKGFKRLYHSDRAEIIWLPEHISAFMKVASIEMQRALIIALHTGQRQGDILRLPWSAYDGTALTLRQGKAARKGHRAPETTVRCTAALRRLLDTLPRISPLIMTTKTGRAFKKRYFGRLWEEATKAAGLTELHFHDLRGTAITMLSEAENTPQQIAVVTGHSIKTVHSIIEKYLARTRHLSDAAIFNFENSPRTKFANQLQTSTLPPSAKKGKDHA